MESPARILVPVDFTAPSTVALKAGYTLAERFGASVHVLNATTLPPFVEPGLAVRLVTDRAPTTVEALALSSARQSLERMIETHPPPAGVNLTHEVQYGPPLQVVGARASRFDLVVAGTHGRTGLDHLFMGSVAERIVRHVDRPVLVAREPRPVIRRVLVPVDFSNGSRSAFRYGAMLARCFGADLRLLHVIPEISALEQSELLVLQGNAPAIGLYEYARCRAQEDIRHFLSTTSGTEGVFVEVRVGDPVEEIIETAKASAVDVVVLGTHGRSDWGWVGVGSVAERVVRLAPCSVLTTRWSPENGRVAAPDSAEPTAVGDEAAPAPDERPPGSR